MPRDPVLRGPEPGDEIPDPLEGMPAGSENVAGFDPDDGCLLYTSDAADE